MNIFILDEDMKTSAMSYGDKHCVKMILEHAQMLCSALHINRELANSLKIEAIPYKISHRNHPCTAWVSKNYNNFAWLTAFTHILHEEYQYRYGNKTHLSYATLKKCNIINKEIICHGKSLKILELNPVCVMPDECKTESIIESYRNYYRQYKTALFQWRKRDTPFWL